MKTLKGWTGPAVLMVWWVDSHGPRDAGWMPHEVVDELSRETTLVVTSGFLRAETEDDITLMFSYDMNNVDGWVTIPKSAIKKRLTLLRPGRGRRS